MEQKCYLLSVFSILVIRLLQATSFICTYCSKKLPERAPTKKQLRVLSIVDQLRALVSCPARTRLPARNGLVNEVEFLGLITQNG